MYLNNMCLFRDVSRKVRTTKPVLYLLQQVILKGQQPVVMTESHCFVHLCSLSVMICIKLDSGTHKGFKVLQSGKLTN